MLDQPHDPVVVLRRHHQRGQIVGGVAILRAGELVEIGTLAEMRHLSALTIDAEFDVTPPDLSKVPGVSAVVVEGHRVRCQITGSVEPLLSVLAATGVHHLLSREPSLEELFLAHYGAARDTPTAHDAR